MSGIKVKSGIINVYKDKGYTSHDIVQILRKLLNLKRIGHTGTLDPDVTGVLPICIGRATRLVEYIQNDGKVYNGTLKLGIATDTQDISGKIIEQSDKRITQADFELILNKFIGEIEQIPPMFSAVHYKGQRLHELARKGIVVDRPARKVYIKDLKILDFSFPYVKFECACSKGTYIRTLADDIGRELGCFATLYDLERIAVGDYRVDESISLDEIRKLVEIDDYSFISEMDTCINNLEAIYLDDKYYFALVNGQRINMEDEYKPNTLRIYCRDRFIGLGKYFKDSGKNYIKIEKMLYQE
ncbi:tRNA pseudouridine(55) synthase TruB [Microaceticoccus formicicus]|uniref:tRNA pseudouridine(55) synthase TruB n=1 Tax=Microaceticoccus formicicus TaxID=3118105 RepID=UPI003CD006FC|nr:tRNA pseudouridine(55) synthase TruB [Peptoniphilaceae bacterium AMB_02]